MEKANNFIFIQAADTQLGLIDNWAGNPRETRVWDEEIRLTKLAIKRANGMQPRPKFFVVCGDLVDDLIGESHREKQEEDFKKLFKELNNEIPLVCVCGNHDVGNTPTQATVKKYRDSFGADYFSFWVERAFFIVINSQYYHDHSQIPEEFSKQEKWLDEQLVESEKAQHCIVFQHIPWFLESPDEPDQYFNIKKEVRTAMLKKFKDSGVRKIFCGHYHRNAGGYDQQLEVVVTSAIGCQLGDEKSGLRLVKVTSEQVEHKYYALEHVPGELNLNEPLP